MPLSLGPQPVTGLHLGAVQVTRAYLGTQQCWPAETPPVPVGKVDPTHPLANRTVLTRIQGGQLQGMTGDANTTIADSSLASKTAGTATFAGEPLPAVPSTLRVSALIKADKTSGRFSYVGVASAASPIASSPTAEIGHAGGIGFQIRSQGFTFTGPTLLADTEVVDGQWYRVTLTWENTLTLGTTNNGRFYGTVERPDGTALRLDMGFTDPRWNPTSYLPRSLVARTNSAQGTVKDLTYVDSMLGVANDNGMVRTRPFMSDTASDRAFIYSTAKAAPLRVVLTAGGSGTFGGEVDWGITTGRNTEPHLSYRRIWEALADTGYTVLHPQALHEGWGADDHLAKQLEALNRLRTQFGDVRLYYFAYSMGGLSAWRALMGRANFPAVRGAYIVAGAVDLNAYPRSGTTAQIATRWPDPALYDSPSNFPGPDLIARGTRVRSVISTADGNVPKASTHDVMKAKYAGNPLFSERVLSGVGHFDAGYWDTSDIVGFFDEVDAAP